MQEKLTLLIKEMNKQRGRERLNSQFEDKSYQEENHPTYIAVSGIKVIVHILSVICGMVGVMAVLSIFFGHSFSIKQAIEQPQTIEIVILVFSIAFLGGLEYLKSTQITKHFTARRKKKKSSDHVSLGLVVSALNIGLSFFGAFNIAQDLTFAKAETAYASINERFDSKIERLKTSLHSYKNDPKYQNREGVIFWEISQSTIPATEKELLQHEKSKAEALAKIDEAYGVGVHAITDSNAKMIVNILMWGQIVIELLIWFLTSWCVGFLYKSWLELTQIQSVPQHVPSSNGGGIPHTAFGGALNNANNPIINSLKKKVAELEEQLEGISEVLPEPINREELYNRLQIVDTNKVLVKGYSTEGDKVFTYGECGQKVNQYKKRSTPLAKRNEVLFSIARDLLENNTKTNA